MVHLFFNMPLIILNPYIFIDVYGVILNLLETYIFVTRTKYVIKRTLYNKYNDYGEVG